MCFVTASVSRKAGGLQDGVLRLAQSCGVDNLSVLGVEDEYSAADIEAWRPLRIQTSSLVGPERFSYSPGLSRSLEESDVDLAHLHGLWRYTSIAISRWHRRRSKPYIVHPHGMLDCWAVRNSRWKKMIASVLYERTMLTQAACIRALCQSEVESIRNYGCQNPICVIPNGMDFPKGPFAEPAWRRHLEPGVKVLFYLGRLHPKKGLMNLLRAWATVQAATTSDQKGDRGQNDANQWVLVIGGWGEGGHELELRRLAGELGIPWADARDNLDDSAASWDSGRKKPPIQPGGLIFLGPQFGKAKADCYHSCDAFILPSFSEGLPMVILEAWSHGKPVLMTPACNLPEGFEANAAIKIGCDPVEIRQGLGRLFAMSQTQRDELGRQGWRLISEKFSWERVGAELVAVSEWVLHGGEPPESVCRDGSTTVFSRSTSSSLFGKQPATRREPDATARFNSRSES